MESIPSLSQSPEPGRPSSELDPAVPITTTAAADRPLEDLRLRLDRLGWAARGSASGEDSDTTSSTSPLEDEEEPEEAERRLEANTGEILRGCLLGLGGG